MNGSNSLAERWRPTKWGEVVGQDKVVDRIILMREKSSLSGRAFWISGPSGTGKTTIARLLAAEVADPPMIQELDAPAVRVKDIRKLEESFTQEKWTERPGQAIIVNESHMLNREVLKLLVIVMEKPYPDVVWIFTTTKLAEDDVFKGYDDASPFMSRCLRLDLARRDLSRPFAERAKTIAEHEGLNGKPLEAYIRLTHMNRNNLRAVLQAIEAGSMMA